MILQELRIGNFVDIDDEEKRLDIDDLVKISQGIIDINDIDSVILKDKTLIDFGFTLYDKKKNVRGLDNDGEWDLFRFDGYILILKKNGKYFLGNEEADYSENTYINDISKEITCVHQLQNIMQSLYDIIL